MFGTINFCLRFCIIIEIITASTKYLLEGSYCVNLITASLYLSGFSCIGLYHLREVSEERYRPIIRYRFGSLALFGFGYVVHGIVISRDDDFTFFHTYIEQDQINRQAILMQIHQNTTEKKKKEAFGLYSPKYFELTRKP